MIIPKFNTRLERQDWVFKNQNQLLDDKMSVIKHAECPVLNPVLGITQNKLDPNKQTTDISDRNEIKVVVAINTTNIIDGHMDAHMPNLWDVSLREGHIIQHVQEHIKTFDHVIADGSDLKVSVKTMLWRELGYNFDNRTQVLLFKSNILKKRNEFMMNQYLEGWVRNHSVGMQYVKLIMAIDNENRGAEFEAWQKYIKKVVNPEVAEKEGFFWVVTEAKVIEGSSVPAGSNYITPTISVKNILIDNTNKINYSNIIENHSFN